MKKRPMEMTTAMMTSGWTRRGRRAITRRFSWRWRNASSRSDADDWLMMRDDMAAAAARGWLVGGAGVVGHLCGAAGVAGWMTVTCVGVTARSYDRRHGTRVTHGVR